MPSTPRVLAGLMLALGACSSAEVRWLRPPSAEVGAWILVRLEHGAPTDAQAAPPGFSVLRFFGGPTARIHALGYAEDLSALGVVEGPLEAAVMCARRCALTRPSVVLELDPSVGTWSAINAEPHVLDFLVPDRETRCATRCLDFSATELAFSPPGATVFASGEEVIDADHNVFASAIIGLIDGSLYRVRGPGVVEPLCTPGADRITAGAFDPAAQRVWVATSSLTVASAPLAALRPDAPCAFTVTATGAPGPWVVELTLSSTPGMVLTLSSSGAIARVRGGRVEPIGAIPTEPVGRYGTGFLVEHRSRIFAALEQDAMAIIEGSHVEVRVGFEVDALDAKMYSALVAEGQLYFGLTNDDLFTWRGGQVVPLDEGPARRSAQWPDPSSLIWLDGRIIASLDHGLFGEWSEESSYCPTTRKLADGSARFGLNVMGTFFCADGDDPARPRHLTWLVPRSREECSN